jgi:general secretion pathway protein G
MNEQPDSNETASSNRFPSTGFVRVLILLFLLILAAFLWPRSLSHPAPISAALTQISLLETALYIFKVDNGYFPAGTNGLVDLTRQPPGATNWHGPYISRAVPKDPWGHDYIYECPGRHNPQGFDISAVGPDGKVYGNWTQR